jgi:hypothetical protein
VGNEKFFLVGFKIICVLQKTTHSLFTVVTSLTSGIPNTKRSRSVGSTFVREIPGLFYMVDVASAVTGCGLE